MSAPLLLGPASLDRWLDEGRILPGGGALNMAYHWSRLGQPFTLLTRIGDDHAELFLAFLRRHGIAHTPTIVAHGQSSSIDILIEADRQPWMDNFVEGVWTGYTLDAGERSMVASSSCLHVVLVHSVVAALHEMHADGLLDGVSVSGDFLSLRRYTIEQFERTMALLDVGIIGWPGSTDDPLLEGVREVTFRLRRLVVVTLGAHGVLVFDGRGEEPVEHFVPVAAVPVEGTTVGCGDSFVAAFLASWWRDGELLPAIEAGKAAGAAATAWLRPLPDEAYWE